MSGKGKPKPRRPCQVCGQRPPAMQGLTICFQCWPGGPITPPPCRRCGSTTDYWTSGLCQRCHAGAPGQLSSVWRYGGPFAEGKVLVEACMDCGGWGATRTLRWLCYGCKAWREEHHRQGVCETCGASTWIHSRTGSCRLCHKQRSWYAKQTGRRPKDITIAEANGNGQQLFIVNTFHVNHGKGKAPYIKTTVPVDMTLLRPADWEQLTFFDSLRDLKAGLAKGFPPPPDPGRVAAFNEHVNLHAEQFGWTVVKTERVKRGIRILLGIQETPGAAIRRSDVALLSRIKHSASVVARVLEAAGMLVEDRQPAVVRWFHATIAELPAPMRNEMGVWFEVLRNGSTTPPRMRPRQDTTIGCKLRWAMARSTTLSGLRSIFMVLKARQLVFINPTARIRVDLPKGPIPPAPDFARLRQLLHSEEPVKAALAALLAFHAVRVWQLRRLLLTDYRNGRLYLGQQVIVLAPPVRQRIDTYLQYRHSMWPTSTNPHMFIHERTWTHHGFVWPNWISIQLGMSPQVIRRDRILDEAHATSGDIKQLVELFGLSIAGAMPYVNAVSHANSEHRQRDERPDRPRPRHQASP